MCVRVEGSNYKQDVKIMDAFILKNMAFTRFLRDGRCVGRAQRGKRLLLEAKLGDEGL